MYNLNQTKTTTMYLKFELWFMLVLFMNSQFWGGIPRNRRVLCRGQIPWNSQSFYSWESLSGFLVKLLVKIVFIQQILPRVLFLLLQVWWTKAKKAVLSIRKLATNLDAIFYNFESIGGSGGGNVPVDMRFIAWYNREWLVALCSEKNSKITRIPFGT